MKVFLVEDNPLNAELAIKLLQDDGMEVLAFNRAEGAFEALESTQPDIVLLDMNLPGMNGYTAAKRWVSDARSRDIPVIAFTAMALSGEMDEALKCGCRGVIYKPIEVLTFCETVRNFAHARYHDAPALMDGKSEPAAGTADSVRVQTTQGDDAFGFTTPARKMAHQVMTQISILNAGIMQIRRHSKDNPLTDKQLSALKAMEEASTSLRETCRQLVDAMIRKTP